MNVKGGSMYNKCIGDNAKAATRQSLNCLELSPCRHSYMFTAQHIHVPLKNFLF